MNGCGAFAGVAARYTGWSIIAGAVMNCTLPVSAWRKLRTLRSLSTNWLLSYHPKKLRPFSGNLVTWPENGSITAVYGVPRSISRNAIDCPEGDHVGGE